mmetsp:Transcript_23555/g.51538  ORF Transcript_23555/g.51538 Transcript_23555/m.51538 type:complete len:156 (-) Transcript_23555:18-485(-)
MASSLNLKQVNSRTRDDWLRSTRALCNAFANHCSMEQIIDCFTSSQQDNILLFEHGLPELAPFLGRAFRGTQGIRDYFAVVSEHLSYQAMSFSDYSVDMELGVVSVRGNAEFTWKSTGKHWNECFIYRIQLDEDGKIVVYEVWADSGAAYLASSE